MKRILIVEDEPDIQELLRAYLEDAGYQTAVAGDGVAALALFGGQTFDLVLLDLMLPKNRRLWGLRADPPAVPGPYFDAHRLDGKNRSSGVSVWTSTTM